MKYNKAINIIKNVLEILVDCEKLDSKQSQFIQRLIDDSIYYGKINENTIKHFKELYPEMFIKK